MIDAPEPGIYENVPFETYAQWDAVNASTLKGMQHAPAVAKYRRENVQIDKPAYAFGRLFHLLATQPVLADAECIVKPETYPNDKGEEKPWHGGAKYCKAWLARHADKTVISRAEMRQAAEMAANAAANVKAGAILRSAQVEVSVVWDDETTGIRCKGRWDVRNGSILGDLKTTQSALADRFFGEAYRYGYHLQVAMYVDAGRALGIFGEEVPWFVFVCVEKHPPYLVRCFDVHDDPGAQSWPFIDLGRKQYKTLLQQYKWCTEHDEWPGYPDEHVDMMLPAWVKDAEAFEMQ